jgi:hypothetical protein
VLTQRSHLAFESIDGLLSHLGVLQCLFVSGLRLRCIDFVLALSDEAVTIPEETRYQGHQGASVQVQAQRYH